jgi:hypothetical protein
MACALLVVSRSNEVPLDSPLLLLFPFLHPFIFRLSFYHCLALLDLRDTGYDYLVDFLFLIIDTVACNFRHWFD